MTKGSEGRMLTTHGSLRAFFDESLRAALRHQQLDAREDTVCYLSDLLTHYSRAERLFDHTEDGMRLRALAEIYASAVAAPHPRERRMFLRRLGDVALFISGLFSGMLSRRPVGIDYYIAMGQRAYASLSESTGDRETAGNGPLFHELSIHFVNFVDTLAEISDNAPWNRHTDLLERWEHWQKSGSRRTERQLLAQGLTLLRPVFAQ